MADNQNNLHYCPDEEKISSIVSTLCNWSNKSKKRSIERQVLRAVLNESFLTHEVKSFKSTYGLVQGTGQAIQQASTDAMDLSMGRKIKITQSTGQCKNDYTIKKCVDFILSDNNVASVSWGTKKVLLRSDGEILLPKLTRKTTIQDMYNRYKQETHTDPENIKSATFYKIANVLTSSDGAMLNSIDYVTCMLVNETCETLQDIIDTVIMNEGD